MADRADIVNAGEQITATPSALPLKPDDQFRLINQRLDILSRDIEKVAKPPHFRVADVVELVAIIAGIAVAIFTGLGLSERISEVSKHQTETEQRLDQSMTASEQRIAGRLDKMSDQFTALDERISRIEGEKVAAKPR
jgi:hypothetical protein